jgi:tungstate transport system ATP-binding protein
VNGDPHILPLRLEAVSYEVRGRRLIYDVSGLFDRGTRSVILGPNGAGKSLMLRLCHGLIRPSAGRVIWSGASAGRAPRHQAMVFQRPVLLRRSAAANIDFALSLRRIGRPERRRRVAEALDMAGLTRLARVPARVLSGGEQQRLALARAWALKPEVLFLDEPTASLDPAATRAVENLIDTVHRSGTKIIMTTHDLGQARRVADEILFFDRGRLIERAAAQAFFDSPESPEAGAFIEGRLW